MCHYEDLGYTAAHVVSDMRGVLAWLGLKCTAVRHFEVPKKKKKTTMIKRRVRDELMARYMKKTNGSKC